MYITKAIFVHYFKSDNEIEEFTKLEKIGEFEENDSFCRLIYTDFYKRLDKFFKKKYDEQVDKNRFNPANCQDWRRRLKRKAISMLEMFYFEKILVYLYKRFSMLKPIEEAFIVNISEDEDVNYVLKYFNRLVTKRNSYAKQVVLITICLWMTILNRRDFFKADNSVNVDSPVLSKSNRLFSAFKVFTTKKDKSETASSPDDENDVI